MIRVDAIVRVAAHRQVELMPLAVALDGFATTAQPRWRAWRRKQRLEDRLPEQFDRVLLAVAAFAEPAIQGSAADRSWIPDSGEWWSLCMDASSWDCVKQGSPEGSNGHAEVSLGSQSHQTVRYPTDRADVAAAPGR